MFADQDRTLDTLKGAVADWPISLAAGCLLVMVACVLSVLSLLRLARPVSLLELTRSIASCRDMVFARVRVEDDRVMYTLPEFPPGCASSEASSFCFSKLFTARRRADASSLVAECENCSMLFRSS